ncbi:MAG: hypothetical protein PHE27_09240, partial [Alphaproteobacteria bacterium]|nr:hypothetical protein [Alphaproteobacteria bacterium]
GLLGLPSNAQGQTNIQSLGELLVVRPVERCLQARESTKEAIKGWSEVFENGELARDDNQLTPFLPTWERTLQLLRADKNHIVTYCDDPKSFNVANIQGPFQLSNLVSNIFTKEVDGTYLIDDDENVPYESKTRMIRKTQFLASLTMDHFEAAFGERYQYLSNSPDIKDGWMQAMIVAVGKDEYDNTPGAENEEVFLIVRADPLPVRSGNKPKDPNEKPVMLVIGNEPLTPELTKRFAVCSSFPNHRELKYIDASGGLNALNILTALGRNSKHLPEFLNITASILDLPTLAYATGMDQKTCEKAEEIHMLPDNDEDDNPNLEKRRLIGELLQQMIPIIVKGDTAQLSQKAVNIIDEMLKGEYIRIGYAMINSPSRTQQAIQTLQNVKTFQNMPKNMTPDL